MKYSVVHRPAENRFEVEQDGLVAFVKYRLAGNALDITHTLVPEPLEGRGIAASLVQAAFEYALENKLKPQATCSYAVAWLKRHQKYAE